MGDQLKEINRIIENEKFMIYGTGYIAEHLSRIIQNRGFGKNVKGFAVSYGHDICNSFLDKKVSTINNISPEEIILIAVHFVSYKEVKKILDELGFKHYIWIVPCLVDLAFGPPVQKDMIIDVNNTWYKLDNFYQPIIYYLAIDCFVGKNEFGRDLYIKCMKKYSNLSTAQKRSVSFEKNVLACKKNGFWQDENIKIAEPCSYVLIDGLHRLTMAYYFNVKELKADVYLCDDQKYLDYYHNCSGKITEEELQQEFTPDEIEIVKKAYHDLKYRN